MTTHRLLNFSLAALVASWLTVMAPSPAQAQQGLAERLGEQLDRGVDRLSEEVREGWESLRKSVDKMGVRGRVYSRLRWDKNLADSALDIDAEEGGLVTLRGRVPTNTAKQKAVELATDTVGVNRVVDELTVEPPADATE